jgi:hypothetical protein
MIRTATELYALPTFAERFRYLSLSGQVGEATFGFDRWINQTFYRSRQWKQARVQVIARDLGCDLGVEGYEIHERIIIHHMNPMVAADIVHGDAAVLNPEYLVATTHQTHNAIHYGDERLLRRALTPRRAGDTVPWRK